MEKRFEAPVSAFDNAKTAHRTVLEALEKAELTSPHWEDWVVKRQQVLTRLHRTAPNTPKPNPSSNNNNNKGKSKNTAKKPTPCDYWNAGTCDNPASEHPGNHVMWLHVCATCFKANGERNKHRDTACPNKSKAPKNPKGPVKGQ